MVKESHPVWKVTLLVTFLVMAIYFKWEAKKKLTGNNAIITHDWLVQHP